MSHVLQPSQIKPRLTPWHHLDSSCEGLWEHEPDEKQVSSTEGQGKQSWSLEEHIICCFGADGKVGTQQRPYGEAQGESDANHGLGWYNLG